MAVTISYNILHICSNNTVPFLKLARMHAHTYIQFKLKSLTIRRGDGINIKFWYNTAFILQTCFP